MSVPITCGIVLALQSTPCEAGAELATVMDDSFGMSVVRGRKPSLQPTGCGILHQPLPACVAIERKCDVSAANSFILSLRGERK